MPRTRRPYPSDLTDQEWDLLAPLLASPERRGRPPKWPLHAALHAASLMQCSTYCAPAAPGECCLGSIHLGKLSTTTFANGAWTVGCARLTSGCEQQCAKRKDATRIPKRGGDRQPSAHHDLLGNEPNHAAPTCLRNLLRTMMKAVLGFAKQSLEGVLSEFR
jgi:hypothetical protein